MIGSLPIKTALFVGIDMKKHWKKIIQYTVDVTFWLCMLATAWFATQV